MALFKYQNDGTDAHNASSSRSQGNGRGRADIMMIDNDEGEEYDVQAALEIEEADQEGDWEPHHHLYGEYEGSGARAQPPKQDRQAKPQHSMKTNGKSQDHEVFEIDDEDEDEDEVDMIPVPIDTRGAIVSDARIEEVSFATLELILRCKAKRKAAETWCSGRYPARLIL